MYHHAWLRTCEPGNLDLIPRPHKVLLRPPPTHTHIYIHTWHRYIVCFLSSSLQGFFAQPLYPLGGWRMNLLWLTEPPHCPVLISVLKQDLLCTLGWSQIQDPSNFLSQDFRGAPPCLTQFCFVFFFTLILCVPCVVCVHVCVTSP